MNTPTITSADVSEWMRQQLAKVHETHDYGHIQIGLPAFRSSDCKTPVFSIYIGNGISSGEQPSIEKCFSKIAKHKLPSMAETKRAEAAKLLADADAIDQAAKL